MPRIPLLVLPLAAWLTAFPPPAFGEASEKAKEDAAKAAEVVQSVYGEDLKRVAATKDPGDDVALASRLLGAAKAAENQPALLALLCERAADLGLADPRGFDTALAAADLLAAKVPQQAALAQDTVVAVRQRQYDLGRGVDKAAAGDKLIDALTQASAAGTAAGDWEKAGKCVRQAATVAHAIRSDKAPTLEAQAKGLVHRQQVALRVGQLKTQVKAAPSNRQAREQLIRLLVVELDNPAAAAAYVDESCDDALRKFVPAAARPVGDAPELACLELGEWYRGLAAAAGTRPAGKAATLERATAYYRRFLDLHTSTDLDRTRVDLTLKKVAADLETLRPKAPDAEGWIDVLKLVDLAKDQVRGQWQRTDAGLAGASPNGAGRVEVPLALSGNYELEFRFVRTDGDGVAAILPLGSTSAMLMLGKESASGLQYVNGKFAGENETKVSPSGIEAGRLYTVVARVLIDGEKAAITVSLDGKPYIAYKGALSTLSLPAEWWRLPHDKCPGLGIDWGHVLYQGARVRMLSGKAAPLRPAETKPAPAPPR